MGWGNSWGVPNITTTKALKEAAPINEQAWNDLKEWVDKATPRIGIDLGTGDHVVEITFEDGQIKHRVIPNSELYKNMAPTHDPYTNPNATIYYECGCGAILDPQTKSFAALNNYASEKGWKIRFGADSYVPYCVKCGENVE